MKKKIIQLCFGFYDNTSLRDLIFDNYDLFNMNVYTNAFNPTIPSKGLSIWLTSKINKSKNESSYKYSCTTNEKMYNVQIDFDKNDYIDLIDAQCNCDKFLKSGRSCEHIYACLYDTYASKNTEKIKNVVNNISNSIIEYKNRVIQFLKNNIDELDSFTTCVIDLELNRIMDNSLLERRINDSNNSIMEFKCCSALKKIIFYDLVDIGKLLCRIKYDIIEYNNAKLKKTFFLLCEEFDSLLDNIDNTSKITSKKNYSIYKSNPIMDLYFSVFSIEQICFVCGDKIKNKEQLYKELKGIKDMILFDDTNVRIIAKNIKDLDAKYNVLKKKYIKCKSIKATQNDIVDNYEPEISSDGMKFIIGDGIDDYLDNFIAGLPLPLLQKASRDNIINRRDNRIIEKAIKNNKEKTKEMKHRKRKETIGNFFHSFTIFGEILSIFSSDSKKSNNNYSSLEQEEILNGNYEPYQFEEEDLEEDDYYFEDDLN